MKTLKVQKGWRLPVGCMAGVVGLMLCLAPGAAQAQVTYKDSIYVPVTFYDFRSDRSNPEFEQPHGIQGSDDNRPSYYEVWNNGRVDENSNGVRAHVRFNMVDSLLDRDGKPRMGSKPYLNHGVRFWFRDWSNLNTYLAKDSTVGGRKYLDQFRPIYTYRDNDNNTSPNTLPPGLRQPADVAGINGGEWEARPNTGVGQVPYAYASGTVTVGGNSYTATATGITMNNRDYTIANAYENKVVKDSLVFKHIGGGTYSFDEKRFFPLDGRGLELPRDWTSSGNVGDNDRKQENQVTNHNFAYTMELVWDFKFKEEDRLKFDFRGDDDVWVFINGKLAMDIGGIHNSYTEGFELNKMMDSHGLQPDSTYKMHMFYCERHSNGSSIRLTTNIITTKLKDMSLKVNSKTLTAGDSIPANAVISVDTGAGILRPPFGGTFTWRATDVTPGGPFNVGNQLRVSPPKPVATGTTKADTVYLYAEKAYTTIKLYGEYKAEDGSMVKDSILIDVLPGPATQVSIEESVYNGTAFVGDLRNRKDVDTIRIGSTPTTTNNFYAVLRDKFENWVGPALTSTITGTTLGWSTVDPGIATAASVSNTTIGQGVATRVGLGGSTRVTAEYGIPKSPNNLQNRDYIRDDAWIKIENITYTDIEIGIKVNGNGTFIPMSKGTIVMTVNSDTTLWARVKRSDNLTEWFEMAVGTWTQSGFTTPVPSMPDNPAASYKYTALGPQDGGMITVTAPGGKNDWVIITAKYNDAAVVRFYNRTGDPTFGTPITSFGYPFVNPAQVRPYPMPTQALTVLAGDEVPLVAALFAANPPTLQSFLKDMQGPGLPAGAIKWEVYNSANVQITDGSATATFDRNSSYSAVFKSTKAVYGNNYYIVRATYTAGAVNVTQDLYVRVNPSYPTKLYIEQDEKGHEGSPNAVREGSLPSDTILLDEYRDNMSVFAVLRDTYGNFVAFSGGPIPDYIFDYWPNLPRQTQPTKWDSDPKNIISTENGNQSLGEGMIAKLVDASKTKLTARDLYTWPPGNISYIDGSINVRIVNYSYDDLRIVKRNPDGSVTVITDLEMTTNDEVTLLVQGKRTDNGEWEEVAVDSWGRDGGLTYVLPNPPGGGPSWMLEPNNTGKGKVTVSRVGAGGKVITAEIDVTVKLGPPTSAEIVITTPPDERIAGKPIEAEITYYNKQGKMTSWDDSWGGPGSDALIVNFADVLTGTGVAGARGYKPEVTSARGKDELYTTDDLCAACYNATLKPVDGVVKVTFIIYNATDNPHQIQLKQTIVANGKQYYVDPITDRFVVKAGDPSGIKIESPNLVGDTLKLRYDDDPERLHAVAVDDYGNSIGDYPSDWKGDHPVKVDGKNTPIFVYRPGDAQSNGGGQVCAVPVINGVPVEGRGDCIWVDITGVVTYALSAVTQDLDGCGYLDAIKLKFPKPIDLTAAVKDADGKVGRNVIVFHETKTKNDTLIVEKVTANPADCTAVIKLTEKHTSDLQTGWTPRLIIQNEVVFEEAGGPRAGYVCIDGAPPVISTAKLYFPSSGTGAIAENYIQVQFSEDVLTSNGLKIETDIKSFTPEQLFFIYDKKNEQGKGLAKSRSARALAKAAHDPNEDRSFELLPDILKGITRTVYVNNSTVRFFLENGEKIEPPGHYINIRTYRDIPGSHVLDVPLNVPKDNNRKVPIMFGNEPNQKAVAIPNPASPDRNNPFTNPDKGAIDVVHNPNAIEYIRTGGGGTVLEVPIYVPKSGSVNCQLKVYDLAGNLVISGEGNRMEQGLNGEKGAYDKLNIYWNGFNSKAMKVAPGTYRMVVYVSYKGVTGEGDKAKNKKLPPVTVGMSK